MRRATPAVCIGFLLLIPLLGVGMSDQAMSAPRAQSLGVTQPVAMMTPSVQPSAGGATFAGPTPLAAVTGFARTVAQVAPLPAAESQPVGQSIVPQGVPVQEPAAIVASPAMSAQSLANAMGGATGANDVARFPSFGPTMGPATGGPNDVARLPSFGPATSATNGSANDMARLPTVSAAGGVSDAAAFPTASPAPALNAVPSAADALPGSDPLSAWGPPPAPLTDPRRFTEAHWQGLELVPKTPTLARALKLPPEVPGVVVDDVTLPADLQGFQAGDLVTHVAQVPTPHLVAFIRATEQVRDEQQTRVDLVRNGKPQAIVMTALLSRLGTANGDSPPMIPPGARMPHPYRGPCTNCHRIGTTGALAADQGDTIVKTAPVIRVGARRPHEDRGPCSTCHQILP